MGEDTFVRAALELERWYFIGVSPPDAPDEPEPMVAAGSDGFPVAAAGARFCDREARSGGGSDRAKIDRREAVRFPNSVSVVFLYWF